MGYNLTIFILLQITFSSIGQSNKLVGMILDSTSNEPIPYAKVFLLKKIKLFQEQLQILMGNTFLTILTIR